MDSGLLSVLSRVARQFGLELAAAVTCSGGFSGAAVYRLQTTDGRAFAVRSLPTDLAPPADRLQWLHRLLCSARDQGVEQVPVPLPQCDHQSLWLAGSAANSGEDLCGPVCRTIWHADGRVWQVEPWLPGQPCVAAELSEQHVQTAMQVLQQWHLAAADFAARSGPNPWFQLLSGSSPAAVRRLTIVRQLLDGQLRELQQAAQADHHPEFRECALQTCRVLRQRLPSLHDRLQSVAQQALPLQPVVRDLWSAHVLFTGTQVTGLIDLQASGTDHVVVDLARLQRSWFGNDVPRIQQLLEQFELARRQPLTVAEWRLLQVLDECGVLLSPVTWLKRRYADEATAAALISAAVLARLTQLVQTAVAYQPLP